MVTQELDNAAQHTDCCYDANGNTLSVTSQANATLYTYDGFNRQIKHIGTPLYLTTPAGSLMCYNPSGYFTKAGKTRVVARCFSFDADSPDRKR